MQTTSKAVLVLSWFYWGLFFGQERKRAVKEEQADKRKVKVKKHLKKRKEKVAKTKK